MRYFPVNLNIRDRQAVIVGGGAVAGRKCLKLLEAGANVTVIAPELDETLRSLRERGRIVHLAREYVHGDLEGAFLVFATTDNGEVNRAVAEEAARRGILCNMADAPEKSGFTMPATVSSGDLLIAISTGGQCPAFSREIREELEKLFGPEYGEALKVLGTVREKLLTAPNNTAYNKKILNDLAGSGLPELFRAHRYEEIDQLLTSLLGPGLTLARLGVGKKDPS